MWANETDTELPHGMWLTASDVDNLKHFIQDYTIRSLIPYIERMVAVLNDAVRLSCLNAAFVNISSVSGYEQERSESIIAKRYQTLVRHK